MSLGKLGKYSLLERLGEGGMGEVFRAATDGPAGFRRELAIKQMRQPLRENEKLTELFLAEARALAELRHRNIVQVFDFDVAEGRPYLVMELLHGVSLAQMIDGAPLPPAGVAFVGAELADALAAVHATGRIAGQGGLVHGDLSPSNVMACDDGGVKLLDFGLARHEQSEPLTGPRAGKLPYLAPELLAGTQPDALTDLYAVGVTLYELLAGERLFRSGSTQELAGRISRADYARLGEVRTGLPPGLVEVVEQCLSRDRGARPQSARQLAKALHGCHPGFGPAELVRYVRQVSGGPSALDPTGTIPRAAMSAAVANGPATATAPPVAPGLGRVSPPRPRTPALAAAVAVALLLGGLAVQQGWSAKAVVVEPVVATPVVAAPPVPAPQPVPVPEPTVVAPVVATAVPVVPAVVATAVKPAKRPTLRKLRPVKATTKKDPGTPERLAPGFIAEPGH